MRGAALSTRGLARQSAETPGARRAGSRERLEKGHNEWSCLSQALTRPGSPRSGWLSSPPRLLLHRHRLTIDQPMRRVADDLLVAAEVLPRLLRARLLLLHQLHRLSVAQPHPNGNAD